MKQYKSYSVEKNLNKKRVKESPLRWYGHNIKIGDLNVAKRL